MIARVGVAEVADLLLQAIAARRIGVSTDCNVPPKEFLFEHPRRWVRPDIGIQTKLDSDHTERPAVNNRALAKNRLTLTLAAIAAMAIVSPLDASAERSDGKKHRIGNVTAKRLLNADAEPGAWLTGGRDYRQSYYSPLTDIHTGNVRTLGFAWQYVVETIDNFEATPLVVDGVMFTSGPKGVVYALDAKTGTERWTFTPEIDRNVLRRLCCGAKNRGVAVWRGKVYVASLDGYLYALNASTGAVIWKMDTIVDRSRSYSITGAPYIAGNLVVIGNSGAEFDARGYVTAYHSESGKQAWRFFTVPADPKKGFEHPELQSAAKTWDSNSLWELGLGGTVWDGMAYDPKLNLLYVGTGNGTPWVHALRSPAGGDNLFLACILALRADTGRLVWYYQTVPGENWDFTATQKPILADLKINGRLRKTLLQAPKNGFFYVLDRVTGELLSAEPYVHVTWASHVDLQSGRPVLTGQGDYSRTPKLVFPGTWGGRNWQPMTYNPATGLVYIPAMDIPWIFAMPKTPFEYRPGEQNLGTGEFVITEDEKLIPDTPSARELPPLKTLGLGQPDYKPHSYLKAWDPVKQRLAWQIETTHGIYFPGGAMSTAGGLVFQGSPSGDLVALDARTGTQLHRIEVGNRMIAAPMTYELDGEQYVAIMGDPDRAISRQGRIIAFKLGGGAVPALPRIERQVKSAAPPIEPFGTPEQITLGGQLFERSCALCHAQAARAPDLAQMNEQAHREFLDIVLEGSRTAKGMGDFSAVLSPEDARAIHAYVTDLAWKRYRQSK